MGSGEAGDRFDRTSRPTQTPLHFARDIETTDSLAELKRIGEGLPQVVFAASRAGADTRELVQLISRFNEARTRQMIALLESQEGVVLPERAAYLALGSEGRGEQTFGADQDNAIVYADDLSGCELKAVEKFSDRIVEVLAELGVPRCPGGIMASNPQWRKRLSEWKSLLDQWLSVPTPDHMVNFGMVQDLRALHGAQDLEDHIKEHMLEAVRRHPSFLTFLARNIVRFRPPLGLFGRFLVKRRGEHKGMFDLKKAGIFAITQGANLMALEAGILGGTTWDKLIALGELGVLVEADVGRVIEAYGFLVHLRIELQLRTLLAGGKKFSTWLAPSQLAPSERKQLKAALAAVGSFLRLIRGRYGLDLTTS